MIQIGSELSFQKEKRREYIADYGIAVLTATIPWLLCTLYFALLFPISSLEALVLSRFASPTSSGLLLPMLCSMSLKESWFYQKARIHTIFDDLDSALFMIPIHIFWIGFHFALLIPLLGVGFFLFLAYRYFHQLNLSAKSSAILCYSFLIWLGVYVLETLFDIPVETLLPAFCLGCMIKRPRKEEEFQGQTPGYDKWIKSLFMFAVGLSLPALHFDELPLGRTLLDVSMLTLCMNLGKCVPLLFYQKQATLRERLALSIATFPRGEIGAGILAISISSRGNSLVSQVAILTLACNFLLTGLFIFWVKHLVHNPKTTLTSAH